MITEKELFMITMWIKKVTSGQAIQYLKNSKNESFLNILITI